MKLVLPNISRSQQPVQPPAPPPVQEMSEMDKILSNVAFGGFNEAPAPSVKDKVPGGKSGDKKKKKKKKKKKRKKEQAALTNSKARSDASSSDTDSDIDVGDSSTVDMFGIQARQKLTPGVVPNARLPELPNKSDAVTRPRLPRAQFLHLVGDLDSTQFVFGLTRTTYVVKEWLLSPPRV